MITPKLEQLIHEGRASARTFVVGLSGNCELPVPDGKYIVIHNICYFPFFDVEETFPPNDNLETQKIVRANKQVQFKSQKTDNHFIFRDSGLTTLVPIILDTYLVHNTSVAISFLKVPQVQAANIVFNVQKAGSVILKSPRGYGNLNAVSSQRIEPAAQLYIPVPPVQSGVTPDATYRGEYKIDHTPQSQLFNPQVASQTKFVDRSQPLMNVQYVLVNQEITDKIQFSS